MTDEQPRTDDCGRLKGTYLKTEAEREREQEIRTSQEYRSLLRYTNNLAEESREAHDKVERLKKQIEELGEVPVVR